MSARIFVVGLACIIGTSAMAGESNPPKQPASASEKLICKRFVETGSLVRGHRECKTEEQWAKERDLVRQNAATGAGVSGCRGSGQTGIC